uniref:Putative nucleoprotein n=1 Tax=Wenling crustacean virus 7 TaxID=1923490 RepID=A0A1L3KPN8_9VIRU|nr:putative nucleoprotein [Wenling crustacean virus 7]
MQLNDSIVQENMDSVKGVIKAHSGENVGVLLTQDDDVVALFGIFGNVGMPAAVITEGGKKHVRVSGSPDEYELVDWPKDNMVNLYNGMVLRGSEDGIIELGPALDSQVQGDQSMGISKVIDQTDDAVAPIQRLMEVKTPASMDEALRKAESERMFFKTASNDEMIKHFNRLVRNMDNWWNKNQAKVVEIQNKAAYDGYNPFIIYAKLNEIATQPVESRDIDFATLIIFAVERGSNILAIKKKTSSAGKETFDKLVNKYKLVTKPRTPDQLSLPRIMLALPWLTCEYMFHAKNFIVPRIMLPAGYPVVMCTSAFSNFIPIEDSVGTDQLRLGFAFHQVLFGEQINPKDNKSKQEKVSAALKFIDLGRNTPFIDQKSRMTFLEKWDIIKSGQISDAIIQAAGKCKAWLV